MSQKSIPHLVPASLVGQRFARTTFGNMRIALVGYCPPPRSLEKYQPVATSDQYFIHVPPESVKRLTHNGIEFLSLVHVYGGPVSASTIEELAYYGFDYILAYGLAGGLGTKGLRMGDFYLVERALAADGTTLHYTSETLIAADPELTTTIQALWQPTGRSPVQAVQAITGDAIYREDDAYLEAAKAQGCDIVNLDSSHLYAVARINSENRSMRAVECGVISDVAGGAADGWDSTLAVMLSSQSSDALNPLELTGSIVEFYIEHLAPVLLNG
jgi:uridine phosphorylase